MLDRSTRRQWLGRSLWTAAGATVATGVAHAATPGAALAATPVPTDGDTLGDVLLVERLVVLGYRQVLASGALAPGDSAALEPFLAHELEHVSTLAARLRQLEAPADTGPLDSETGDKLLAKHHVSSSLTDLHERTDCLRLLIVLESVAAGAYFTALNTISSAADQTLSAQAMACEAQHWTVISGMLNPGIYADAVPWPFVTGRS